MPGPVTCTFLVAELARGSTLYSWSSYTMLLQGSVFIIVSQRVNFVLMVFLHDVALGISFFIIISERVNFVLMVFVHDVALGISFL